MKSERDMIEEIENYMLNRTGEDPNVLSDIYTDCKYILDYDNERVIIGTKDIPAFIIPMSIVKDIYHTYAREREIRREEVATILSVMPLK